MSPRPTWPSQPHITPLPQVLSGFLISRDPSHLTSFHVSFLRASWDAGFSHSSPSASHHHFPGICALATSSPASALSSGGTCSMGLLQASLEPWDTTPQCSYILPSIAHTTRWCTGHPTTCWLSVITHEHVHPEDRCFCLVCSMKYPQEMRMEWCLAYSKYLISFDGILNNHTFI